MIALPLPVPRLNHVLGAAATLLAGLALWPWLVPPVPAIRPLASLQTSAPAPPLALLPPLATYAATVERPLFAPSRRPPPGATAMALGPSIESRFRLLGIVSTGGKRKAFIADGTRRREIDDGDMLEGWTVKEIGQDRVVLSSPAGEASLKLTRAAPEPARP
jgi:hypothetical protein